MTPRQRDVFENVLAIGHERPYAPVGIVEEVRSAVANGIARVSARWSEPTLWLSKSTVMSVRKCEAGFLANRLAMGNPAGKTISAAVGDITHRAIQLAYTHPGHPSPRYIDEAIKACRASDAPFELMWSGSDMATQSDAQMAACSRLTAFLDSWPPLQDSWEPRFEESMQVKVGGVILAARADLVLGRPRASGQQSMVIVDWKSGALRPDHADEAGYHALVATLSLGVPPFRSLVYSLTSGDYCDPDVTAASLRAAARATVDAASAVVDLLTERRAPAVRCEQRWCNGCNPVRTAQAA